MFLHRLEQRRLDFGRCPIDFIGQNQIGENGTFSGPKRPFSRIVNHGPDQICGEQVGSKLNPIELTANGTGQPFNRGRLGQSGETFQ